MLPYITDVRRCFFIFFIVACFGSVFSQEIFWVILIFLNFIVFVYLLGDSASYSLFSLVTKCFQKIIQISWLEGYQRVPQTVQQASENSFKVLFDLLSFEVFLIKGWTHGEETEDNFHKK